MTGDIFIQIASYRDPQLIPTLRDAVDKAADPSRLHFCIAWQHGDEEGAVDPFAELRERAKFTIIDIPYAESKGVCWARNLVQQQYQGEQYTLQLDSHHRFVEGWENVCIGMVEDLRADGVEKPLLTAYLPSYNPERDPEERAPDPWYLALDRFIPEGAIFFLPRTIADWPERTRPVRSRFYSAHFAFTIGAFATEVQHNPEYYFHGEEISIAVRAFTHGYDLFHPHKLIAWHEYTRRGRTKHWDDHPGWGDINGAAHVYNRKLFGMDEFADKTDVVDETRRGPYGLGSQRTFEAYERFAGICFRRRAVTRAMLADQEPSPSDNLGTPYEEFMAACVPRFRHCLDIGPQQVPLDDYDFWRVAFQDASGKDMFRQDADEAEIALMREDPDGYCKIWRHFDTDIFPTTWVVWPHSKSHGWCPPIVGTLR